MFTISLEVLMNKRDYFSHYSGHEGLGIEYYVKSTTMNQGL